MIGHITSVLAEQDLNIANMLNRHHQEVAYNIIDIDGRITATQVEKLKAVDGIIKVRVLPPAEV